MPKRKGGFACLESLPDLGKYVGKWIGIVDNAVVSSGRSGKEVFAEAKDKFPESTPLLLKVPDSTVMMFVLDRVSYDGKCLRFREPIKANVTYRDNMYYCQNSDLGIISSSSSLDECIKDLQDEVVFLWNEYGKEEDSKLTKGAKELKAKILSHVCE